MIRPSQLLNLSLISTLFGVLSFWAKSHFRRKKQNKCQDFRFFRLSSRQIPAYRHARYANLPPPRTFDIEQDERALAKCESWKLPRKSLVTLYDLVPVSAETASFIVCSQIGFQRNCDDTIKFQHSTELILEISPAACTLLSDGFRGGSGLWGRLVINRKVKKCTSDPFHPWGWLG